VAFGIADEDRTPEIEDAVEIELGGGRCVKLRGSIDRVDRDARGGYHVWDYKTGSAAYTHEQRGIAAGRQIQPALYALAWESLLARAGKTGSVVESGYFFPGRRGLGERFAIGYSPEETRQTLNALFDLAAAGAFAHSPDESSDCFACRELTLLCANRKDAARSALQKLRAATGPALAAWRRLRDA
jgi:ATP-dependent helicase/nuclease subunit B